MTRILVLSSLLVFASVPARAQSSNPQHATPGVPTQGTRSQSSQTNTRSRIVSRTNLVLVPVTVKDSRRELVAGLERSDFQVFCDGIEQQIALFDSNAFPLSAVVLIDDNLAAKQAKQVQKSLVSISAAFGPSDEAAVMTYSDNPQEVAGFSFNNDALFTQLKRLELGAHSTAVDSGPLNPGGPVINGQQLPTGQGVPLHGSSRPANNNALDDAIYAAGQMLRGRGRDRRKIIFLISDGSNSRHNAHTYDETLRFLLESDIYVYSISVSHSIPGKSIFEHGLGQADRYAIRTGGDTFYAGREEDLDRLYSEVTEEARNQYTLTFSPHGEDKSKDYHTIEVRVRRPDLDVSAPGGYYASALGTAQ